MPYFEGSLDSKIALVGEAPGFDEELQQRPFVGASGKELNRLLTTAGLQRASCYITNVFKFRPANNNVTPFINLSKKVPQLSNIYRESVASLENELRQCKANIIVALGNTALYALTGHKGIMKHRGSIYKAREEFGDKKVIATIHPSAVLRTYINRWFVICDLIRAVKESTSPVIASTKDLMVIHPTKSEVFYYLDLFKEYDLVSFDIEVHYNQVSHISFAIRQEDGIGTSICIPFLSGGQNVWSDVDETYIWFAIASLLESKVTKVAHNAAFDVSFLYNRYGIVTKPIEDSMIAAAILHPDFPKRLDFITSIYTKYPYYKDDGKKWRVMGVSEDQFRRYNVLDSVTCLDSFLKILDDLKSVGLYECYKRQRDLVHPLVYISNIGFKMDTDKLSAISQDVREKIEETRAEFYEICGKSYEDNKTFHNSSKQLMTYFYYEKGIQPYHFKGKKTINEKALKRIAAKGYKEASILLSLRRLIKLQSTYLKMRLDDDNRMRCSMNPVGTVSGRISSSKTIFGTGGNMQNLHPLFKSCMRADDGYYLVNWDKAQAENRVVAYIANEAKMIHAFEHDIDLHKLTASLIFNKPIEEISDEPGSCQIGGGVYSERFWGKKANHGLNYDLGYKTFALYYEIKEVEAKKIVESYHIAYPAIRRWHASVRTQLQKNRSIISCGPFYRKRIFRDRWGDQLYKDAYSFIPQSTVADLVNQWGTNFIYYSISRGSPIQLLNTVHDSDIIQVPLSLSPLEAARLIISVSNNLNQPLSYEGRIFSIPTDVQAGFNFGSASKDNPTGMRKIPMGISLDEESLTEWLESKIYRR